MAGGAAAGAAPGAAAGAAAAASAAASDATTAHTVVKSEAAAEAAAAAPAAAPGAAPAAAPPATAFTLPVLYPTFVPTRKSTKFDEKSLPPCFADKPRDKNLIFSHPSTIWRRFWWPRRAPGRPWALFLTSRGAIEDARGAPVACRVRPVVLPRRSRDITGTLLGATWCPERFPGPILLRF